MSNYQKRAVIFGLFAVVFLAVSLAVAPPVSAQGAVPSDLCFKVTILENEQGTLPTPQRFTMNVHLDSTNGIHYTAWGKVVVLKESFYIGGTGILEGNILTLNLTTTQKHLEGWRDTGVMQVRYNVSTTYGSFYEVGHDFDSASKVFDERYTAGNIRLCP